MFIKKIILRNFRIYSGKHEFDFLNKKIIIIDGSNGHGKSTLFDAINWVVSGKIPRYVGSSEYQQFNYLINSDALGKGVTEAEVEIHINSTKEIRIKRKIDNRGNSQVFINDRKYGIRDGQSEIIKLLIDNKNNSSNYTSIDLLSFIESTLILSQENLEGFVRGDKPKERFYKIERVLGLSRYGHDFKKYLMSLKKDCTSNHDLLNSKYDDLKHKQELLKVEYKPKSNQRKLQGNKSKEDLLDELRNVSKKLKEESFLSIDIYRESEELTVNEQNELTSTNKIIKEEAEKLERYLYEINNKNRSLVGLNLEEKIIENEMEIKNIKEQLTNFEKDIFNQNNVLEELNRIVKTNIYLETRYLEENKIKDKRTKLSKYINNIFSKLGYDNEEINYELISNFEKEFDKSKEYLDNLLHRLTVIELEDKIHSIIKDKKHLREQIKIKIKNRENTSLRKDELQKHIHDLNSKKEQNLSSKLNVIIHEVQSYLAESDEERCLVCGTEYQNNEKLKKSIFKEMESSTEYINEMEISINNYKANILSLNKNLETVEHELSSLKVKEEKIENKLQSLENKVITEKLLSNIDIKNNSDVLQEIEKTRYYIEINQQKYNGFIEIKENKKQIDNLSRDLYNIHEEQILAMEKHEDYSKFINNQNDLENEIARVSKQIDSNIEEISILNNKKIRIQSNLIDFQEVINLLTQIKKHLKKWWDIEVSLNSREILSILKRKINWLELQRYNVQKMIDEIDVYLNDISLRDLELKIENTEKELNTYKEQIMKYTTTNNQLEEMISYHSSIQSSLIKQYLNELSKTINGYFRQISPHSYFNYVHLEIKDDDLFVLLNEKEILDVLEDDEINNYTNASLTLSAAQSTILAMSIFLALNKTQNWSKLNIIGIDDPFQNLDDINAYSFIDVISNLILNENRQVFISTHDSNFSKLTFKKLNLNPEDYAYVKINSYTKDAIDIKSEQHKLIDDI